MPDFQEVRRGAACWSGRRGEGLGPPGYGLWETDTPILQKICHFLPSAQPPPQPRSTQSCSGCSLPAPASVLTCWPAPLPPQLCQSLGIPEPSDPTWCAPDSEQPSHPGPGSLLPTQPTCWKLLLPSPCLWAVLGLAWGPALPIATVTQSLSPPGPAEHTSVLGGRGHSR